MKLRLLGTSFLICAFALTSGISYAASKNVEIPSSFVYQAINKYKIKNYTGCIQDMDYIIKRGRPTDIAYYYKALSYSQLGMNEEAKSAYQSAANISSNSSLIEYANQAVSCIDDSTTCDINLDNGDITKFIKSNQFMHEDAQNEFRQNSLERAKEEINSQQKPTESPLNRLNMNDEPTDKEIADAVRTFSRLGINPFNGFNSSNNLAMYNQNSELAQMNALFGNNNNNNNNMMNLVPMLSSIQSQGGDKSQVSKEFVQAFMMNQMLPSFNFGNSDK